MRASDEIKGNNYSKYDRDLTTSKHDEIVIWLFNKMKDKRNVEYILSKTIYSVYLNKEKYQLKDYVPEMERPITKIRSYPQRGQSVIGFWDLSCVLHFDRVDKNIDANWVTLNFEVKTDLNIGESVRQVRFYESQEENYKPAVSIICAPPHKNTAVLESQNIIFIPYKVK